MLYHESMGIVGQKIELRAFLFSLVDSSKEWLYYLPSGTISTWTNITKLFLERYISSSNSTQIIKELYGIRKFIGETLYEYWERFNRSCASCPYNQISEQLLQYFYKPLMPVERSLVNVASKGALVNKN